MVDAKLTFRPELENTLVTAPQQDPAALVADGLFDPDLAGIAAHGYQTGFSTMRVSDPALLQRGLINAVLMFPDAPSASAAAAEKAARAPLGDNPTRPIEPYRHPEALARAIDHPDGSMTAVSFLAHGRYVLYQWAHTALAPADPPADLLIKSAAATQADIIDRFVPTDPAKLAELPKDPTGQPLAKTLASPDNRGPMIVGVWQPTAWVNFEDNPLTATSLFTQTGVSAVAQRTTTVYQTTNAQTATQLTDSFADQIAAQPGVDPTDGVPDLPTARCFTRPEKRSSTESTMSVARIFWHYQMRRTRRPLHLHRCVRARRGRQTADGCPIPHPRSQ